MSISGDSDHLSVSFVLVVKNGEDCIANTLADYFAQDFPPERRELLVVDGSSTDSTVAIAREIIASHPQSQSRILDNPAGNLAAGWNVALAEALNSVILRVDAHTRFGPEFISRNMAAQAEGNPIVGGWCESTLRPGGSPIVHAVELSRFGAGGASFRNPGGRRFVDTIGHAAYHRDVFEAVGTYDERFLRNQDVEIHIRMRRAGFKFLYDPAIYSRHHARPDPGAFLKQKYLTGYWLPPLLTRTLNYPCPQHFAPFIFFTAVMVTLLVAVFGGTAWPLVGLLITYLLPASYFGLKSVKLTEGLGPFALLSMVLLFLLTHMSYGCGTFVGFMRIPIFLLKKHPQPATMGMDLR
jgi:glycosyltransferase involved in cell wall biosynthesis